MRHVEGSAKLGELLLNFFGSLPVTFGGRCNAERAQQVCRGPARITRFAEDRMEALPRQVVKHEINDAPGVKSLFVHALVVGIHAPEETPARAKGRSQLETVVGNVGFTL
jgi:hypothetical protein